MNLKNFVPSSVILDNQQEDLLDKLGFLSDRFNAKSIISKIFSRKKHKGLYIWGPVGRGKTVLLKAFFDSIKSNQKGFYHYQAFLRFLHEESHKLFQKGEKDYVKVLSENLAKKYKILIIDELEIRDITDAMLIQRITQILLEKRSFIAFTSNFKPDNLYQDGLQREQFYNFINQVNSEFLILNLDNSIDYRFRKISSGKALILEGDSDENKKHFDELLNSLTHNKDFKKDELYIFGRKLEFSKVFMGILYLNLNEIINKDLSYNDFLAICEKYDGVILLADQKIENDSNKAIRFINFIDNIYSNKLLFIGYFSSKVSEFCESTKYESQFKRAASRIAEMNSVDYINQSKYYRKKNV